MDICDVALFSVLIQVRAHQRCYKHYTAYINVGYFEAAREKFLQEVYIRSERKKKELRLVHILVRLNDFCNNDKESIRLADRGSNAKLL